MSKSLDRTWFVPIMNIIGDWNPQLWRELTSRVTGRNVIATICLSIAIQLMLWIGIYRHQALRTILWTEMVEDFSTGIAILMCVAGVYFLTSNFRQEERRGTLDHLRLTPQTGRSILIGKILGVPILVYWAVVSALPLQFYAAHQAKTAIWNVWTWDLAMFGLALLFYLVAILITLWLRSSPILITLLTGGLAHRAVPASLRWHGEYGTDTLQWYGIPLDNQPTTFLLLTAMSGLAIYWLFQALERRYHQPTATILSRRQSYGWSLSYHLFLLGFVTSYAYQPETHRFAQQLSFNFLEHIHVGNDGDWGILPVVCFQLLTVWFLFLIPVILPSTQSFIEWAKRGDQQHNWWQTRLWNDRSPATLAVLVNIAIASGVWSIPVTSAITTSSHGLLNIWWLFVVQITMIAAIMALGSTVIHLGLFWRASHPRRWQAGIFSIQWLAILILGLSYADPNTLYGVFMITQFFWSIILFGNLAFFVVFFGLWIVMSICLQQTLTTAISHSKLTRSLY